MTVESADLDVQQSCVVLSPCMSRSPIQPCGLARGNEILTMRRASTAGA